LVFATAFAFASGEAEAAGGDESWTPSRNVEWYCTSSPGGGSSIFTQQIIEIIKEEGLVDEDILINYKTDGGGAVGRREVSRKNTNGHTLLTFNNGDLQPLVQLENGDLDMFTPLAVMATDGQILLVRADSRFETGQDFIDAINAGERIIINGSKGDDINLFERIEAEVGGDLEYLINDSTGDALTQILGGNADAVIAKPAASYELVAAGELRPLIAATRDGFGEPFEAPTFKELGFDIELTVYRGIVGPASMPQEAVEFWSDVFGKVAATDQWRDGYLNRFLLTGNYLPADESAEYMQDFEDIYTASN
jgi:putative tricarboxylic transport membrane protein